MEENVMFKARRGSMFAMAISLTAVFLTMIVGTMAYFEASAKSANSEKWRAVAEQAARSGLDFLIGWGESDLDRNTKLPASWEMNDGEATDPISAFADTPGINIPAAVTSTNALGGTPAGRILGTQVGEYVLGRVGNYIVSFKARIQQFRMSEDAPRQYRIGVAGRVRKVSGTNVDGNEKEGIVAERLLLATIGKEPFSRYAALIDIDAVKNWVPGEIVQGPMHINRGYLDEGTMADDDMQAGAALNESSTFMQNRSFMKLHFVGGPGGFQQVGARPDHPEFHDTVSMTIINDKPGPGSANDDDTNGFTSALTVDGVSPGAAGGRLGQIFKAPDNQGALGGMTGPIPLSSPIPLPPSSRRRLATAVGCPPAKPITDLTFLNSNSGMPDGLFVPTRASLMAGGPIGFGGLNYNAGVDNHAAGGIYLRGNVEVMRMTVGNTAATRQFSYYLFQMGYGGSTGWRRVYMVRADRVTKRLRIRAFGPNIAGVPLSLSNTYTNPWALSTRIVRANGPSGIDQYFTDMAPSATSPAAFAIHDNQDRLVELNPVPDDYSQFPFNGVIFVDRSNGQHANTGNIFSLGCPGAPTALGAGLPNSPFNKIAMFGSDMERVATYAAATANTAPAPAASKLTIVTAGHIFVQNHLVLEDLFRSGDWQDPIGDNISINETKDLLGLVADRQVVFGLAAPDNPSNGANRQRAGCIVHGAIAALQDPDATSRTGVRAYWGSVATEGLQQLFNGGGNENYGVCNMTNTANLPYSGGPAPFAAPSDWVGVAAEQGMPGNPYFANYNTINTRANNPNRQSRGRLLVFGSVTQKKRGAVGAGNNSFDKDFRYDKRLMSIAPPMFPNSATIQMRVSMVQGGGEQPYRGGQAAKNPDLKFMGVPAAGGPTQP
jgi:hypothetical protein